MRNPMIQRLGLAFGLAISLCASAAYADNPTLFQTVDSVNRGFETLELTGILSGASTATTQSFTFWVNSTSTGSDGNYASLLNSCAQSATLMMNRPGRFTLAITVDSYNNVSHCTLKRNP